MAGSFSRRRLHRDLHPINVLLSPKGPVVIDWTNAARGSGASDVALTWLLMTAGEIPGGGAQAALGRALRGRISRPAEAWGSGCRSCSTIARQIGRAHVLTPVTLESPMP